MGFKTTNYEVKELNITIDNAYAKISNLTITNKGVAYAIFNVQQDREATENLEPLEVISYSCPIDKTLPVHEQVYTKAKEDFFKNWEDDIILVENNNATEEKVI